MRYRVVQSANGGMFLVMTGTLVIEYLKDEKDATELAEYLNGGKVVPLYMKAKEEG